MPQLSLFISCVSNEFGMYRDALRKDLSRPNLTTKIQEDFTAYGSATLQKLDEYIQNCEAVIHLCGDMTGSMANTLSLVYINKTYPDFITRFPELQPVLNGQEELSYTQWEAWLAAYHGKYLFIATPAAEATRKDTYTLVPEQQQHQQKHLDRLKSYGYYSEIQFSTEEGLALQLYRSKLGDLLAGLSPNKLFNLPYHSIGSLFKGREEDLTKLYQCLKKDASRPGAITGSVIHGMGGTGKTRLAVEYAWSYQSEYTALLLVNASSPENLFTNLAGLAAPTLLNLPEYGDTEARKRYAAVLNWLNQHPSWLLILDNADTPESAAAVEDLFARLSGGCVLITSRQREWSRQVNELPLNVLKPEAAVAFLLERTEGKRRTAPEDEQLAARIGEELGWLALALEQAGAYIGTRKLLLTQYQQAWQQNHDAVLEWYNERLMQYPGSVAITWQTSVDQLAVPARTLLNRLAWLALDPIPETLFDVKAAAEDDFDYWEALTELDNYSLVNRSGEKPELTVHRLIQDVTRRKQEKESTGKSLEESMYWINKAFSGDPYEVKDWPVLEPLLTHAMAVIREAGEKKIVNTAITRLMNRVALLYFVKAQYGQAEPLMQQLLQIDEAVLGKNHSNIARDLNNLSSLLQVTNRLIEAEPMMRRALQIDEDNFGENHPEVAKDLNNLASLLQNTDRLEEAEPLMRRGLQIAETCFGENHPSVAMHLNNFAQLLQATNRPAEAEPLMRRALQIDEARFDKNHPNVARDLNNLAQLFQATNRLEEAEPLMRRALQIDEDNYGKNHPDVATDLSNLGWLLRNTNRTAEAEPIIRRALQIDEACFGRNHPHVAIRLNNLAQLLADTGRLEEAEPYMRRALQIVESSFDKNHPKIGIYLKTLATLLRDTNRLAEAEPLMRKILQMDEMNLGGNHPDVAVDLDNLATLLRYTNRLPEAEPLMRRMLQIEEANLGENHPDVATDLKNLADLLQHTNRAAEAETLMQKALQIDETCFGENHPKVATGLNNLAYLLKASNRLSEAEPLLRRAYIIFLNTEGYYTQNTQIVLRSYISILEQAGKTDEDIRAALSGLLPPRTSGS